MPDPSIERIERECAEARQRTRDQESGSQRRAADYWSAAVARTTSRESQAYAEERARLHTLMLAALEADRVAGEAG